jgi:DNA-binding IclR family transcriptional regulator
MSQLERSLDLLEYLAEHGEAGAGEITKGLGAPRASVHRMLATLQSRGYIERVANSRKYRLGLAVRSLASHSTGSLVVTLAAPALANLRSATGETVNLAVVTDGRIVYGATLDGVHLPRMAAVVGQEVEPHATALGKAILATLSAKVRESLLWPAPYPGYTPRTITDPDQLERELSTTAELGYAVDDEESTVGAVCVAAPIRGGDGMAVGALSISGITARIPPAARPGTARLILDWCERISGELAGVEREHS